MDCVFRLLILYPSAESKRSKSAPTTFPAKPARAKRKTGTKSRNAAVPKASRSNKKSSLEKPTSPETQSKSKRGVPQLPDIMEEDEDDFLDDRPTTSESRSLLEDLSARLTGKKRAIESVDPSAESPEPIQKRTKRTTRTKPEGKSKSKATARTKPGKPKGNDTPSKPKVSKGRHRRTPERDVEEEGFIHGAPVTAVKRKKTNEDRLSNNRPVRGVKRKKVETETETEDESPGPKKANTASQELADTARRMPTTTAYVFYISDLGKYFDLSRGQETQGEHVEQAYQF